MTQKAFDAINQVAVIIADGEVDLIQEWNSDAVAHVKDLRGMGCNVRVRLCVDWSHAQALADKLAGE